MPFTHGKQKLRLVKRKNGESCAGMFEKVGRSEWGISLVYLVGTFKNEN